LCQDSLRFALDFEKKTIIIVLIIKNNTAILEVVLSDEIAGGFDRVSEAQFTRKIIRFQGIGQRSEKEENRHVLGGGVQEKHSPCADRAGRLVRRLFPSDPGATES
jgi:hypothetical protein